VGAGVKGYVNGKQEAREKLIAKADAKLVKDLAKQKAIRKSKLNNVLVISGGLLILISWLNDGEFKNGN
jgi:hypothetical protein